MAINGVFIILSFFTFCKSELNEIEINISKELIKNLNVKNCIFVTDSKENILFSNVKILTFFEKIYTTVKTPKELMESSMTIEWDYFKMGYSPALHSHKIAIIWKTDLSTLNDLLKNVIDIRMTSQFDWIIFLEETNISNKIFAKTYAPFESNFLIVYPVEEFQESKYEILEIYKLRADRKTFVKNYGTWRDGTGLIATNEYIYSRRFNLEGSILILFTFSVKEKIVRNILYKPDL